MVYHSNERVVCKNKAEMAYHIYLKHEVVPMTDTYFILLQSKSSLYLFLCFLSPDEKTCLWENIVFACTNSISAARLYHEQ